MKRTISIIMAFVMVLSTFAVVTTTASAGTVKSITSNSVGSNSIIKPSPISKVYNQVSGGTVTIKWTRSREAKFYIIKKKFGSDWRIVKKTTSNCYKTSVPKGKTYFRISGAKTVNNKIYNGPSKLVTITRKFDIPKKITNLTAKISGKTATIKWSKTKGADYYILQKKAGSNWKTIKKTTATSAKTKLAVGKNNYRVCGCTTVQNKTYKSAYKNITINLKNNTKKPTNTSSSSSGYYYTPTGKKYHSTKNCVTLSRSKNIISGTLSDVKSKGLEPCKMCH